MRMWSTAALAASLVLVGSVTTVAVAHAGTTGNATATTTARQVLAANDGWASAGAGTTGGAAADDAHVFVVHTRD
jgi:pectate lyase